jgi:hypothetical protein
MESLYLGLSAPLVFKRRFDHFSGAALLAAADTRVTAMSLTTLPKNPSTLADRLHESFAITPSLIDEIIREACRRFPSQGQAGKTKRVEQLIAMGAWTDAALALIDLELPQWRVRRLAYDDGEWYCSLSRERELPDWLDQSVDGHHADLALAILAAFVEVQRNTSPSNQTSVPAAGRSEGPLYERLYCEDFA